MKYEQSWQARVARTGKWFPAEVPGNVQYDWAKSIGGADNLMFGTNVNMFRAVEDCVWEYRTELAYEPEEGKKVFLVFEGIDYYSELYLDGESLGFHEGMFTRIERDVTEKAHPGSVLTVVIYPHPKSNEEREDRTQANQSCKPPSVYEWDWNPRLLISGIWQNAWVETRGAGYISSCEPFYTLNGDRTAAEVRFETECALPVTYRVTDPDGNTVYEGTEGTFTLENPRLWWCAGQGEQALYSYTVSSPDHEVSGKIGFRTVRLVRNAAPAGVETPGFPVSRYPVPITVELNGRRIFAKGSNWVNPELFFGRVTEARYRELLDAAKEANMNILRLWGGSGIKKKAFYEICDEYGILLWQEFMLACNDYAGTEHYLSVLEQEAREIIVSLRRHPSILLWCGGNELFNGWSGMTDQSLPLRLLNKLTYELDPARPFLSTSPLYGMKHGCYVFDDGRMQVYEMFQKGGGTAYSEFGVPSAASVEDLKKIIPEDELFPPTRTKSWLIHHGFEAWGSERWLCLDVIEKYFGKPESIEQLVDETNRLQCEGYKAIFEEARKQYPACSMALNWCFNEPWITAANNSLLTYPAKKKPAFYAVRDALRPTLASARIPKFDWREGEEFTAEVWLLHDAPEPVSDKVFAEAEIDGRILPLGEWATGRVSGNLLLGSVRFPVPAHVGTDLILRLRTEGGRGSEYRLLLR